MNNISSSLTDVALVVQERPSGSRELSLKRPPCLNNLTLFPPARPGNVAPRPMTVSRWCSSPCPSPCCTVTTLSPRLLGSGCASFYMTGTAHARLHTFVQCHCASAPRPARLLQMLLPWSVGGGEGSQDGCRWSSFHL